MLEGKGALVVISPANPLSTKVVLSITDRLVIVTLRLEGCSVRSRLILLMSFVSERILEIKVASTYHEICRKTVMICLSSPLSQNIQKEDSPVDEVPVAVIFDESHVT